MAGPAPVIPVGGYVMAEMRGLLFGQQVRTRFFYSHAGVGSLLDTDGFRSAFNTTVMNPLMGIMSEDLTYWECYYKVWTSVFAVVGDKAYNETHVGGVATEAFPPSVAVVVRKKTGLAGRINRGRWFLAGLPVADHDEGSISVLARAGYLAALDPLDDQLTAGAPAGTQTPGIAHFNPVGALVGFTPITDTYPDWVLRSQRRREVGVGI